MTEQQYIIQSNKLRAAIERKYMPLVARDIQGQINSVTDLIYAMGPQAVANHAALLIDKKPMTETMTKLIKEAGLRYAWLTGKDILLSARPLREQKARLWGFSFDAVMDAFIRRYLAESLPQIIDNITKTTAKKITEIITEGLNWGKSNEMMIKELQRQGDYSRERATTIVRTEAQSAQNALAIDNARRTGLSMQKKWLSNLDKKVRYIPRDEADHAAAHGQQVPLDAPFMIETEKQGLVPMDYPGDKRKAPVEAWIKCRCTLRFTVNKDARGRPIRIAENALYDR